MFLSIFGTEHVTTAW